MTTKIRTYEDLLQEEKRLEAQIDSYKLVIKEDIDGLKEGLNPIKRMMDTGKKFFTRDANAPILNFGVNFGIDLLIRRMLLAKAGWAIKFMVPFIMKNFTSHVVADADKGRIEKSLKKFFKKVVDKFKKDDSKQEPVVVTTMPL